MRGAFISHTALLLASLAAFAYQTSRLVIAPSFTSAKSQTKLIP
jgi:hypothetical protein